MDDASPFLRTIAENPHDDTPRLVFADWLDDRGHPERAEFIRLQCELANLDPADPGYPEKTARMRRCGVFTGAVNLPHLDDPPVGDCRFGYRRGFVDYLDTGFDDDDAIDTSRLGLFPITAVRTNVKFVGDFEQFKPLRWLELYCREDSAPSGLSKVLGPHAWFPLLEELSLTNVRRAVLEAGVIPKFDLPRLRNFYLSTDDFYNLGLTDEIDPDDEYGRHLWGGFPDALMRNAIPGPGCPLERFVWHSDDDEDYYLDQDPHWPGPTLDAVLERLTAHGLKQIEVAVGHDDHENGSEGVIAAPCGRNPLDLCPTLERVTLAGDDLARLDGPAGAIQSLRVYECSLPVGDLFRVLERPVFSGLESLHLDNRHGHWGVRSTGTPRLTFPRLKFLRLSGWPAGSFADCQFPDLVSLDGYPVKAVLERKWPRLQNLAIEISADQLADLKRFAGSDCCPILTTLTLGGRFDVEKADLSFLAACPHMPHLSLIRILTYGVVGGVFIVADGRLVPVRDGLELDDPTPTTPYQFDVPF